MESLAKLHSDPGRRAYYAGPPAEPIVFDHALRCWVVTGRENSNALLRSPNLLVPSFEAGYAAITGRYGLTFPHLAFASQHLPLWNNGEVHQQTRRRMAQQIGHRRAALNAALPDLVERYLAKIVPGEVELIDAIIEPLVTSIMGVLAETEVTDQEPPRNVGRVFDRMIGLRDRQRLDQQVGAMRQMIRASAKGELSLEDEGTRLSFFVFGQDSVVGTLGATLHRLMELQPGERLDRVTYPPSPAETGVPYAERIVAEPFSHAGIAFAEGELVRIMVQEFAYSDDPEDAARLFGVGIHACIGRQLALDLWRRLTDGLSSKAMAWHLVSYRLRDDFLFLRPVELRVRFQ